MTRTGAITTLPIGQNFNVGGFVRPDGGLFGHDESPSAVGQLEHDTSIGSMTHCDNVTMYHCAVTHPPPARRAFRPAGPGPAPTARG